MKDKIVFWLGSDLTHYCIAYYLQKLYDCEIYAIIDITNKPKKFFIEQKLVQFKKIWFFHDHIKKNHDPNTEYLSDVEKRYNINIWKLAINERIFYRFYNFHKYTEKEILSIDEQACRLFEEVLDEVKPDFIATKEPAFHHLEIFYRMSMAKGIKILMLSYSKLGGKSMLCQETGKMDFITNLDMAEYSNRSFENLQNYLKSFDIGKSIRAADAKHGSSKLKTLRAAIEFFFLSDNKNLETNYNYYGRTKFQVILQMISAVLKKKYRKQFINKNLIKNLVFDFPFVYFPLGVDLERNLLINAPFFNNQVEILRHIVKSLPPGYTLCVKENPSQSTREWRSIGEYKEIMNIPNLKLLHPEFPKEELISKCSLVITITGTSAFEGTAYGKPSIVFADVGYSLLPSVFRCTEPEKLPDLIRKALATKVTPIELDKYLQIYEKYCFDFDWFNFSTKYLDHFYYGGGLVDTNITVSSMNSFLENNKEELTKLANEHTNKILEFKKTKIQQ